MFLGDDKLVKVFLFLVFIFIHFRQPYLATLPTQVSASSFKMPSSGSLSLLDLKQKKRMNLISNSILKCIITYLKIEIHLLRWINRVFCGCACLLLWFCNETRKKHLVGFRYKKLANTMPSWRLTMRHGKQTICKQGTYLGFRVSLFLLRHSHTALRGKSMFNQMPFVIQIFN